MNDKSPPERAPEPTATKLAATPMLAPGRVTEPVPPACRWLPRCYGARCVRVHWMALDLWHSELHRVLELPELDEACVDCPSLIDILEAVA